MTEPRYTITLDRETVRHMPNIAVTGTGDVRLTLTSDEGSAESVLVNIRYGKRQHSRTTADELIRRHLAHAWRQEKDGDGSIPHFDAVANRRLLIDMAHDLYPSDPCALADLLAKAYERGTEDARSGVSTIDDVEF